MNFVDISEWLKNSIPGIIILGACGSFFAIGVSRVTKPIWSKLVFSVLFAHVAPVLKMNYEIGFMEGNNKPIMAILLLGKHFLEFMLSFWASIIASIYLLARILNGSGAGLSLLEASLSIFVFLGLYNMLYKWWMFKVTYDLHVAKRPASTKEELNATKP